MNIMMIIINTISICYVMLRNKLLFSYFYLNKNNITMEEFINFVNSFGSGVTFVNITANCTDEFFHN